MILVSMSILSEQVLPSSASAGDAGRGPPPPASFREAGGGNRRQDPPIPLIHHGSEPGEGLLRQVVLRVDLQRALVALHGLLPMPFLLVHAPQVEVRKRGVFVPFGVRRSF